MHEIQIIDGFIAKTGVLTYYKNDKNTIEKAGSTATVTEGPTTGTPTTTNTEATTTTEEPTTTEAPITEDSTTTTTEAPV